MTDQISIISLGEAGKNIAEHFRSNEHYDVHTVDSEGDPDVKIPRESGPEEYEKNYSDLEFYEELESEKVLFILSGSGDISGAAGPLLEPMKEDLQKDIVICYIEPDLDFLSKREKQKERVARNVLMQMTRSAVFERMFFFSNPVIEEILGGLTAVEYFDRINQLISYTIQNYYYYQHTDPVFGRVREPDEICRLSTMGIIMDEEEEYFYPLELIAEKEFYFNFSEEELKNDETLVRDLKEAMRKKKEGELNISLSYGLYESSHEEDRHLCVANTHVDQSLDFEEE